MKICSIVLLYFGLFVIRDNVVRGDEADFDPDLSNDYLESSNSPKRWNKRLVEGRADTMTGERNYIASFQRKKDNFHLCIVSFITLKTVVTTCSCVLYVPDTLEYPLNRPQDYEIVAGVKNLDDPAEAVKADVKKMLRDKKCEYIEQLNIWVHNLGYMELKDGVTATPTLNVIPNLPSTQKEYELAFRKIYDAYLLGEKRWCWTYGWGADKPDLFNCVDRLLFDSDLSYVPFDTDNSDVVCAGGLQIEMMTGYLCYGDQGGPLICNDSFVAVGTPTKLCAAHSKVSIFQKLKLADMLDFKNLLVNSIGTNKCRFVVLVLLLWSVFLLK